MFQGIRNHTQAMYAWFQPGSSGQQGEEPAQHVVHQQLHQHSPQQQWPSHMPHQQQQQQQLHQQQQQQQQQHQRQQQQHDQQLQDQHQLLQHEQQQQEQQQQEQQQEQQQQEQQQEQQQQQQQQEQQQHNPQQQQGVAQVDDAPGVEAPALASSWRDPLADELKAQRGEADLNNMTEAQLNSLAFELPTNQPVQVLQRQEQTLSLLRLARRQVAEMRQDGQPETAVEAATFLVDALRARLLVLSRHGQLLPPQPQQHYQLQQQQQQHLQDHQQQHYQQQQLFDPHTAMLGAQYQPSMQKVDTLGIKVLPHQPVSQLMMQQPAVRQLAAQQLMPAQQPHMSHQHAAQLHHVPQMLPGQQVQQPLQVEDQQLPDPWAAAMEPLSVRPVAAWQQLAQQQLPETPIVRQQVAQAHTSQPHASPPYAAPTLAAQRHSAMPHTMQQQVVQPPAAPRVMQPPAAQQQVGQQQQLVQQPEVCTHFSKYAYGTDAGRGARAASSISPGTAGGVSAPMAVGVRGSVPGAAIPPGVCGTTTAGAGGSIAPGIGSGDGGAAAACGVGPGMGQGVGPSAGGNRGPGVGVGVCPVQGGGDGAANGGLASTPAGALVNCALSFVTQQYPQLPAAPSALKAAVGGLTRAVAAGGQQAQQLLQPQQQRTQGGTSRTLLARQADPALVEEHLEQQLQQLAKPQHLGQPQAQVNQQQPQQPPQAQQQRQKEQRVPERAPVQQHVQAQPQQPEPAQQQLPPLGQRPVARLEASGALASNAKPRWSAPRVKPLVWFPAPAAGPAAAPAAEPAADKRPCSLCRGLRNASSLEVTDAGVDVCKKCMREQKMAMATHTAKAAAESPGRAQKGRPGARGPRASKELGHQDDPIVLDSDEEEGLLQGGSNPGASPEAQQEPAAVRTTSGIIATRSRAVSAGRQLPGKLFAGLRCVFPPNGGRLAVEVCADDLNRLEVEEFLNDTVIDFYMKVIERELGPEARRFYFFNSFFFKKLTEKAKRQPGAAKGDGPRGGMSQEAKAKADHERLMKWTKGVDIFSKDYLFIPIHDALHWSLVVVCFPGEIGRAFEDQQRREQVKALGSSGGSGSSKGAAIPKSGSGGAAAAAGGGVGSGGMLGSGWEVQVAGSGEQQVQAGGQQGGARLLPVERRACLLHLDSMPGGHATQPVMRAVRWYLQHEWERKRLEGVAAAAAAAAVARQGAAVNAGGGGAAGGVVVKAEGACKEEVVIDGEDEGANDSNGKSSGGGAGSGAGGSTVPYRWSLEHPEMGPVQLTPAVLPQKRLDTLPQQDNYCDCGLFLLSYLDFFTHAAPSAGLEARLMLPETKLKGRAYREAAIDAEKMTAYPGFLTPDWFCPRNAGLLRDHIRALLHRLMAQQAEDQKAPQVARLMELADEHEARDHRYGVRYLGPKLWLEQLPYTQAAQLQAAADQQAAAARRREERQERLEQQGRKRRQQEQGGRRRRGPGAEESDEDYTPFGEEEDEEEEEKFGGLDWVPDYDSEGAAQDRKGKVRAGAERRKRGDGEGRLAAGMALGQGGKEQVDLVSSPSCTVVSGGDQEGEEVGGVAHSGKRAVERSQGQGPTGGAGGRKRKQQNAVGEAEGAADGSAEWCGSQGDRETPDEFNHSAQDLCMLGKKRRAASEGQQQQEGQGEEEVAQQQHQQQQQQQLHMQGKGQNGLGGVSHMEGQRQQVQQQVQAQPLPPSLHLQQQQQQRAIGNGANSRPQAGSIPVQPPAAPVAAATAAASSGAPPAARASWPFASHPQLAAMLKIAKQAATPLPRSLPGGAVVQGVLQGAVQAAVGLGAGLAALGPQPHAGRIGGAKVPEATISNSCNALTDDSEMEYEASPTPPDPKKLDKLSAEALGGYELALAAIQRDYQEAYLALMQSLGQGPLTATREMQDKVFPVLSKMKQITQRLAPELMLQQTRNRVIEVARSQQRPGSPSAVGGVGAAEQVRGEDAGTVAPHSGAAPPDAVAALGTAAASRFHWPDRQIFAAEVMRDVLFEMQKRLDEARKQSVDQLRGTQQAVQQPQPQQQRQQRQQQQQRQQRHGVQRPPEQGRQLGEGPVGGVEQHSGVQLREGHQQRQATGAARCPAAAPGCCSPDRIDLT